MNLRRVGLYIKKNRELSNQDSTIKIVSKISLLILGLSIFYSCGNNAVDNQIQDISFSTSTYHPAFLFSKERNDTLAKSLKFTFNDWAVNQNSEVVFGICNEEGQMIGDDNSRVKFLVNDQPVKDGKLKLGAQSQAEGTLNLSILFSPSTANHTFHGYIKVFSTDLDRINNLDQLSHSSVLSWSANQKVVWNPLLKYILWGLAVIIGIFLIWITILRPIVYRRFGRSSLTIQSPFFKKISLKGAIHLTLDKTVQNQKRKERLMMGKKIYYSNPFFSSPIYIFPKSRTEVFIKLGSDYSIQPYAGVIKKGSIPYTVVNLKTKEKITLTLN